MNCNLRRHSEQRFCCGGCHRAFSSTEVFDWHRRGGRCADPATNPEFVGRKQPGLVGDVTLWGQVGSREWPS